MQRISRGLYASTRARSSTLTHHRLTPVSTAFKTAKKAVALRALSVACAVQEPSKCGHSTRRLAQKQLGPSTLENTLDKSSKAALSEQINKSAKLFVHQCIIQQQMPLEDVLPLVQHEVRTKTLRPTMTRRAVDSFYFFCAQQATERRLSEQLRRQVLRYFDQELFVPNEEQETEPFQLGQTLNEAVFGSVIKLHLAGGDTKAAWLLINKLRRALKDSKKALKLHFRTVSPLLEYESKHGDFLCAYSMWQQLKQHDVEWTSAMEDVLVQMVVACVKYEQQVQRHTSGPTDKVFESSFHVQMSKLLHDLQLTCREVSSLNAQRLLRAFRSAGYRVDFIPSDSRMRPQCPSCGHKLTKQGLSELERAHMMTAIESRHSKVMPGKIVKEFLDPFRDWLMRRHEVFKLQTMASDGTSRRLHYVLDGPNIAYINQNFQAGTYRLDQVDAVAKQLQAQGHLVSITMPVNHLADKFVVRIRNNATRHSGKFVTRERTDEEKNILARWRHDDLIYSCRTEFLSDDLFWLYASVLLASDGRVVTNDQGRDHVFALLNGFTSTSANARTQKSGKKSLAAVEAESEQTGVPSISMDLIARWKDMTTVNIEIKHEDRAVDAIVANEWTSPLPIESINLHHPLPFSRVPQVTAPQHFHIPITTHTNQNEHPNQVQHRRKRTRWLCAHRPTPIVDTRLAKNRQF